MPTLIFNVTESTRRCGALHPESKAHRDPDCVRLRLRRSQLVHRPACFCCVRDCTQDNVASSFLKDGETHVQDSCCAFSRHFQSHFRKRCRLCWPTGAVIETLSKRPGGVRKLIPTLPQISASWVPNFFLEFYVGN